jgi:nucleotide-binding universal stress UspA family protein
MSVLPKIEIILYATDLSVNSQPAFNYAASLAEKYGAKIIVLHVMELPPLNPYLQMKGFKGIDEWERIEKSRGDQLLQFMELKLKEMCNEMNSHVSACTIAEEQIVIRKGVPFEEILKIAQDCRADLIVIGTHGYRMVQDALMGGTARRLLRRSEKPILVVPRL